MWGFYIGSSKATELLLPDRRSRKAIEFAIQSQSPAKAGDRIEYTLVFSLGSPTKDIFKLFSKTSQKRKEPVSIYKANNFVVFATFSLLIIAT